MAASSARQGSTSSKSSGGAGSSKSDDDTKRRFREALDRKMAKSTGGSEHKDGAGKQSRAHGPVESRREFRRKSG
ncbi:DUF5302 domain-containing protein [Mycobacterium avium subsp. hominissuis]|uniref:DUF5302 domain-containing protein n=1 Tax=Mycobacterium avium TaxID=1764 RepID=UPI00079FE6BF|nr:DUF5302 domain-containing protein [Mycobacterium avium]ATO66468.1 DUF5302 domain-containing protein [Mycobacterium avium subsp. hominissuis]ATO71003.1 DUF5302 domain-containing protein [Mycobacterium avium subsp. hominissuis]PBD14537.1 hypothetical protein BI295_03640 [Mycobacterium avium subsp. hominissuis]PBJ63907.1 hypothetical protein BB736_02750 [Mycobacterium avium subsp. hominissuis]PBJ65567.1 hypothetical protein BB737_12255 [Mycobacterium avium subsp. hominissuis]